MMSGHVVPGKGCRAMNASGTFSCGNRPSALTSSCRNQWKAFASRCLEMTHGSCHCTNVGAMYAILWDIHKGKHATNPYRHCCQTVYNPTRYEQNSKCRDVVTHNQEAAPAKGSLKCSDNLQLATRGARNIQ